jgi:hypothetical protein
VNVLLASTIDQAHHLLACYKRAELTGYLPIMSAVGDMISELSGAKALLACSMAAGLDEAEVLASLYASCESRLGSMSFASVAEKQAVTEAITGGPWTDEYRKMLARLVMNSRVGVKGASERADMQDATRFENLIPETIWACLRNHSKYSKSSRMSMMATLAWLLGVDHPTEPTLHRMISIIAYTGEDYDSTQDTIKEDKLQFKNLLKSRQAKARVTKLPYVTAYPADAKDLPDAIKLYAYDGQGIPPPVRIPELDTILGNLKMRTPKAADWLQHVPPAYREQFLRQNSMKPRCAPQISYGIGNEGSPSTAASRFDPNLFRGTRSRLMLQGGPTASPEPSLGSSSSLEPPPSDTHLAFFRSLGSTSPLSDAVDAVADEIAAIAHDGAAAEPADCDIDDMERALLLAADKRMVVKKAAKAKAKGVVMARPAAAVKDAKVKDVAKAKAKAGGLATALKKPAAALKKPAAAAGINFDDVFSNLRKDFKSLTRGAFTCRAYDTALRRMKGLGHSEEESKLLAREMHSRAAALWTRLSA